MKLFDVAFGLRPPQRAFHIFVLSFHSGMGKAQEGLESDVPAKAIRAGLIVPSDVISDPYALIRCSLTTFH
jgi:hypothetical protein